MPYIYILQYVFDLYVYAYPSLGTGGVALLLDLTLGRSSGNTSSSSSSDPRLDRSTVSTSSGGDHFKSFDLESDILGRIDQISLSHTLSFALFSDLNLT